MAVAIIFGLCGLVIYRWFNEIDHLRTTVADMQGAVEDQAKDIARLRDHEKDEAREKKESAQLEERRQFRKDLKDALLAASCRHGASHAE